MAQHPLFIVDAFTARAYDGNPCAVVFDADPMDVRQMQCIAREMNLSETAFVLSSKRASFRVRYFTPRTEIPFAGHPTIATVYAMATQGHTRLKPSEGTIDIEFEIGVLPVKLIQTNGVLTRVVMTQPVPTFGVTAEAAAASAALRVPEERILTISPPQVSGVGVPFLMIGLPDRESLLSVSPDWSRMESLCHEMEVPACYVYAPGGSRADIDLCARFFDPFARYEDPFTGSACGAMAALARRNGLVAKDRLCVEQGEAIGRKGCGEIDLSNVENALLVGGEAVLVASGTIARPPADTTGTMRVEGSNVE